MNLEGLHLRALEPEDLEVLERIENDVEYWPYSNQTEPFSRYTLKHYINQQTQDIFEVKQKRFVISAALKKALGFIDLFDFEPLHRRAGVGVFVLEEYRDQGVAATAIRLLHIFVKEQLNLKNLYANVAKENSRSVKLFTAAGYEAVGIKKDWNFYRGAYHDEVLYQKSL
jgi:diamine N-acetyltransferase